MDVCVCVVFSFIKHYILHILQKYDFGYCNIIYYESVMLCLNDAWWTDFKNEIVTHYVMRR